MKPIIEQQFELHFGDDYDATLRSVLQYTKTILNKPPLVSHKYRIFDSEGGGGNLSRRALSYIIEKGDVGNGLKAFSSYLNEEYSSSNNRANTHHTKWAGLEYSMDRLDAEAASEPFRVPFAASLSGDIRSLSPFVEQTLQTDQERELFSTIAALNGSIVESFNALDLDHKEGWRIWYRIYRRQARLRARG